MVTAPRAAHKAMDAIRYYIGVLLVVSIPPAIIWWFIIHPFVGFWRRVGVAPSLSIVTVLMVGLLVALIFVRDPLLGSDLGASWPTAVVGLVLLAVAIAIGVKRKRYLTMGILSGAPELQADGRGGTLLTQGPYAVIRHPRYVEVVAGVFGYACLSNHVGGYVTALATIPILHLVVLMEERELATRFGDAWTAYQARVPRYVPRRRPVSRDDGPEDLSSVDPPRS